MSPRFITGFDPKSAGEHVDSISRRSQHYGAGQGEHHGGDEPIEHLPDAGPRQQPSAEPRQTTRNSWRLHQQQATAEGFLAVLAGLGWG